MRASILHLTQDSAQAPWQIEERQRAFKNLILPEKAFISHILLLIKFKGHGCENRWILVTIMILVNSNWNVVIVFLSFFLGGGGDG